MRSARNPHPLPFLPLNVSVFPIFVQRRPKAACGSNEDAEGRKERIYGRANNLSGSDDWKYRELPQHRQRSRAPKCAAQSSAFRRSTVAGKKPLMPIYRIGTK